MKRPDCDLDRAENQVPQALASALTLALARGHEVCATELTLRLRDLGYHVNEFAPGGTTTEPRAEIQAP